MIKSINQLVTRRCNSRCIHCNIWKGPSKLELSAKEFSEMYSFPEFRDTNDICISGGEPTLREDLNEVVSAIVGKLKGLDMLFLSSNCTKPKRLAQFIEQFGSKIPHLYLVASLEGDRETHKRIRGIDNYDLVKNTLIEFGKCKEVSCIISTTLSRENCNPGNIQHLVKVGEETGAYFSFRIADSSEIFYGNTEYNSRLSNTQMELILDMVKNRRNDPFMKQLLLHLSGKRTIMGGREKPECQAGEIGVFIDSDGTIHPCIYSSQIIGNRFNGIFPGKKVISTSACPCCTECQVYPKLNYGDTYGTNKSGN